MLESKDEMLTEPTSGHKCYMCSDGAVAIIHDERGCRPACKTHLTWRMQRQSQPGHDGECLSALSTNNPVR